MTDLPPTRAALAADLTALGLREGDTVIVHSSLRAVGWVPGGRVAVVQALLDVLGPAGTLVVPAQTMANSDPKHWERPPVPEAWWPVVREHMPAFDPAISPSVGLGALAEAVRTWPGAVRSNHPQASFAAIGARAASLMATHELDSHLGEGSPLAALERVGARVLLLGVGFEVCTAFHLAEYRVPSPKMEYGCAMLAERGREWITYTDIATNSDDFDKLGAAYEQTATLHRASRRRRHTPVPGCGSNSLRSGVATQEPQTRPDLRGDDYQQPRNEDGTAAVSDHVTKTAQRLSATT